MTALGDRLRWLADEVDAGHPMHARLDHDEIRSPIYEGLNAEPVGAQLTCVVYTAVITLPPPLIP